MEGANWLLVAPEATDLCPLQCPFLAPLQEHPLVLSLTHAVCHSGFVPGQSSQSADSTTDGMSTAVRYDIRKKGLGP